jgi:hypothetical protein
LCKAFIKKVYQDNLEKRGEVWGFLRKCLEVLDSLNPEVFFVF